ncbi:Uncharacterised protein [Mycobacterium tuberculosis]|uniref:Uncharacterized protein n=1 Tax=Mycobacterium tuberculosis TaxID=1773 RepID=A0A916L9L0_MYCTX|nr:hypothetical protein IQ38_06015 [Mycobacterium tuberculosis]COX02471.1 Uncharacterised protein [Mycobacterium tuberculosis]COX46737.1 Uncharacterised protein [Mycobacterium tuberculosis]
MLLLRCFRTQLATQIAQREVVEGEAALPRPHQVGRQCGVGGDALQGPTTTRQVMNGRLCLMQGFGFSWIR